MFQSRLLLIFVVISCQTTKDINEKLVVEKTGFNMFDLGTVTGQSQINEFIRKF